MDNPWPVWFSEIKISNYKNLHEARMILGDLSVLVGRNNSGKSNFFEIVRLLKELYLKGQDGKQSIIQRLGGWNTWTSGDQPLPTTVEFSYSITRREERIDANYFIGLIASHNSLIVDKEYLYYKSTAVTGPQKKLFEREKNKLTLRVESDSGKSSFREHSIALDVSTIEIISSLFPESEGLAADFKILLDPIIKLAEAPIFKTHNLSGNYMPEIAAALPVLKELQEKEDSKFHQFRDSFCETLDIETLSIDKYSPPNAKDKHFYFCIVNEKNREDPTLISSMSDGTRVLFLMLYHLFVSESPIVFIDEPEIGLHPNAISRLLDLFHKKIIHKQVVMATHSAYLLNLLNPKDVTLAEPDENGFSTFKPVYEIPDLQKRLRSKYVNFGDLFADNFRTHIDTAL